jgi:hypothetical protein
MTTIRKALSHYLNVVAAGLMGTRPPVGWAWLDGTNTSPTPMRRCGPTDVAPGSDAAPTPARRGTTT